MKTVLIIKSDGFPSLARPRVHFVSPLGWTLRRTVRAAQTLLRVGTRRPPTVTVGFPISGGISMRLGNLCLSAVLLSSAGLAGAQCNKSPARAFNGLVSIVYPKAGGSAMLQRACDVGSRQLANDLLANARAKGVPVKWVEIYGARNWGSTFHDLIYKTRAYGYNQVSYIKYNVLPKSKMSGEELLVYSNKAGKYIAMASYKEGAGTASMADVFVVYGN